MAWFLNEELEPYEYGDAVKQGAEFPNDDHTPYPTLEAAETAAQVETAVAAVTVTQKMQADLADQARADFDKAYARLATTTWPALEIRGEDAFCPYGCGPVDGEYGVVEVDCAIRWNPASIDPSDKSLAVNQADSEFETLHYMVTCCNRPVDLPKDWDTSWS